MTKKNIMDIGKGSFFACGTCGKNYRRKIKEEKEKREREMIEKEKRLEERENLEKEKKTDNINSENKGNIQHERNKDLEHNLLTILLGASHHFPINKTNSKFYLNINKLEEYKIEDFILCIQSFVENKVFHNLLGTATCMNLIFS